MSTTMDQIEARLRAARPRQPHAAPPALDSLWESIERAERRRVAAGVKPRGRSRRRRAVVGLIAALLALAAAASGALLLTAGKSLPPAFVLPANPETGLGQPLAATLAPLPIRVADPQGGPPWGMRALRTTRGLVCLQGGRVVDGQLGGLGVGYAFGGDGRFHPFLAADAIATDACPAVGGSAPAIMPGPPVIVTANALPLAGENVAPVDQVHCDLPGQSNWGVRCPQPELREVAMGLLGPDATRLDVTAPGASFAVSPYGPEGAYLIVLPAQPRANQSMRSGAWQSPFGFVSNAPGGAMLAVTYRDGSHCRIPIGSPQDQCHAHSAAGGSLPSAVGPATGIQAVYVPVERRPQFPLLAWARSGNPDSQRAFQPGGIQQEGGPALSVSFRAPLAAPDASTAYVVELRPRAVAGCPTPLVIVSQPTERTIAAGERVAMSIPLEDSCATSYAGRVFLARSSSIGGESGGPGPLYEVIAAQFGGEPGRSPTAFPTVGRFQIAVP